MRIGFDFRMGGSINSGIGRYIFEVLNNLASQAGNFNFFVFYNKNNVDIKDLNKLSQFSNITLVETAIRHYSLSEQLFFPKILNRYDLDLMHFPNFNVPVFYKGKFIVTIHDMVHHKISGHKKSTLLFFYGYKYVINKAAQKAEAIITVTEAAKKDIVAMLNVPPEKVNVIYEAPFLEPVDNFQVQEVKDTFLLKRPYFLFVGTLERKKNLINLAKGFDLFIQTYKLDMDLVIAGKVDPHYPDIKFQMLEIKNHDRLVFTGFINDSELAALYQGAYAFVTTSLYEGFGLPGVEAMQFGLPVLASNTDVFNEVYDNAAIYFDATKLTEISENLHLIARDQQFYEQMREKSLQRSSYFSWQRAASQTLELYLKVLKHE